MFGKHFLPSCGLSLYFLKNVIRRDEVLSFEKVSISITSFVLGFFVCVQSKKALPNPRSLRFFSLFFYRSCISLGFTFSLDSYLWCEVWIEIISFLLRIPNVAVFVEKTVLSAMITLVPLCEPISGFYYVPLMYGYMYPYADTPLSWLL